MDRWGGARPKGDQGGSARRQQSPNQGWFNSSFEGSNRGRQDERGHSQSRGQLPRPGSNRMCFVEQNQYGQVGTPDYHRHAQGPGGQYTSTGLYQWRGQAGFYQPSEQAGYGLTEHLRRQLPQYTPHPLDQQSAPRQPTESAGFQRSTIPHYTPYPVDRQYATGQGSAGLAGSSGLSLPPYTPHPFDRQPATGHSGRQLPLFTPHPLDRQTATGQSGRQLPLFTPNPLDRQPTTGQSGRQLPLHTPNPLDRQPTTGQSGSQLPLYTPHPLNRQHTIGQSGRQIPLFTPHPLDRQTATGQSGRQLPLHTPHPLDRQTATGQSGRQLPLSTPNPLDRQPATGHSGRQRTLYIAPPFDKKIANKPPTEGMAKPSSPERSRPKSRQKLQPQEKARIPSLDNVPPQRQRSYSDSDFRGSQIPRRARARSEPPNIEKYVEPRRRVGVRQKYPEYFINRFKKASGGGSPVRGGSFEECQPAGTYWREAGPQRPLVRPTDKTGANECLEYLRITSPQIEEVVDKFFGTVLSPLRTRERDVTWDHFREIEPRNFREYFDKRQKSSKPRKRSLKLYIAEPKQPSLASIYERPGDALYEESDSSDSD